VRLMCDHDYLDVFVDGEDLLAAERSDCIIRIAASSSTDTTMRPARTLERARHRYRKFRDGTGQANPSPARQNLRQSEECDDAR